MKDYRNMRIISNIIVIYLCAVIALSKGLERHMFNKLYDFLSTHDLISNHQSAFRRHFSCQSLLIKITDYLLRAMNNGNTNGLTMLHFRKAFNLVDHPTLLCKLNLYGLDDRAVLWFISYLSEREFQVSIGNQWSSRSKITTGVPQGSILGPLLFIFHMNNLPLQLHKTQMDLYADDATQYVCGEIVAIIERKLTEELQPVAPWSADNKIALNTTKTKAMVIETSGKLLDLPSDFSITIRLSN